MKKKAVCVLIMAVVLMLSSNLSVFAQESEINQLIEENKEQTPAVSVMVFDGDRDLCTVIYGEANKEAHIPADKDTVYEWGSVSKMLVWVSAMQLYEQGKLNLNEDIFTYLPKDFAKKLHFNYPVTMLNLMNHNAGFQDAIWPLETSNLDELKPLDVALLDTEPAQVSKPGTTVAYSNWGTALAGYVVECISGMPYAEYVSKNIFAPLHMEHSYIRPDVSDNVWAAEKRKQTHCYATFGETEQSLGECRAYIHLYPAGSAGGTIADMATFAKAFLCDSAECPLFEKPDTLHKMLSPSLCYADGSPRICHGLFVNECESTLVGHGGNTSGFSSMLQLDFKGKTGFVMMTNSANDRVYKQELPELLYGKCDFAEEDTTGAKYDFSGKYYVGGTACAGPAKLSNFLWETLDMKNKNGSYVNNMGIVSITPLSDGTAKVELVTGAVYKYHLQKDDSGNIIGLQNKSVDFEKLSDVSICANYIAIALPAISFMALAILLLIHIITLKKNMNDGCLKFRLVEIFLGVFALLIGADLLCMSQYFAASKLSLAFACCAIIALDILIAASLLFCNFTNDKPSGRTGLILETVCGVILIAGTCYWKLYQFWGY